jgi:hypothetical protein
MDTEPSAGRFNALRFGEVVKLASSLSMIDPGAEADALARTLNE